MQKSEKTGRKEVGTDCDEECSEKIHKSQAEVL